jgi:hypothetical protein
MTTKTGPAGAPPPQRPGREFPPAFINAYSQSSFAEYHADPVHLPRYLSTHVVPVAL